MEGKVPKIIENSEGVSMLHPLLLRHINLVLTAVQVPEPLRLSLLSPRMVSG